MNALLGAKVILRSIFLAAMIGCSTANERPARPNIVIILTDDQGYQDVGCFGSPDILTPNLDHLADEGLRLTSLCSAQAVCSAARAGLLTGCYPNRIGIHGAYSPNSRHGLHLDEVTIAEMLKPLGYHTAIFGKWHLGDHPDFMPGQQGFDEFFGIPYSNDMWPLHPWQDSIFNFGPLPLFDGEAIIDTLEDQSMLTTQITERSVDFIRRNRNEPFFLYVPHPQPHVPLFVSDKFKGKSPRGLYGDVIMEIDWSVGRIISTLDELGLRDNTLVIFTSDNGPWLSYGTHAGSALPLREGKGTAWEGGQRVPGIVSYPAELPSAKERPAPMMQIDILPTIAELTGARLPNRVIDGKSLWSYWRGLESSGPQTAYFHYYHVNELHGVRYGDWKLYFPHAYRTLNDRDGGRGGIPEPYEQDSVRKIELYHLPTDIAEEHDLSDLHPEVVDTIHAIADEMRRRIGDALFQVEGAENRPVGIRER